MGYFKKDSCAWRGRFEPDDIICSIAPRAFLIIAGTKDPYFPIKGVKDIETKAIKSYSKSKNKFKALYFKEGHIFPKKMREKAYDWLDLHLK